MCVSVGEPIQNLVEMDLPLLHIPDMDQLPVFFDICLQNTYTKIYINVYVIILYIVFIHVHS